METVTWSTILTKMETITLFEPTTTTMVDDDLSQGGAAAPDAKVARRKMTGLSNKVRPYHHGHSHLDLIVIFIVLVAFFMDITSGIRRVGCGRL